MKYIKARAAWVNRQWLAPFYCLIDSNGRIAQSGTSPLDATRQLDLDLDSLLLPGFINAHSHSFQFAMGGLTEKMNPALPEENFWTWREAMYQLALSLDPQKIRAITAANYLALLREGYTHVCEFHYLHHDLAGKPYQPATTLSEQIIAAAKDVGIGLTLVPVYYKNGSFDQVAAPQQRRFIFQNLTAYFDLLQKLKPICERHGVILGHGAHSLRAVPKEELVELLNPRQTTGPIHIHIAEQQKEVADCLAKWKASPVAYLFQQVPVDQRFTLVHATHLTAKETDQIAKSGATVALCPTTEANLGDGLFATQSYFAQHGSWAIGSDSHIGLSPVEELRWIDYQVRLAELKRNPLATMKQHDSAKLLFEGARSGGVKSAGFANSQDLQPGNAFTAIALDVNHLNFIGKDYDVILSSYVFSGDKSCLSHVFVNGEQLVTAGRHKRQEAIVASYRQAFV